MPVSETRVVITGIGAISPLGNSPSAIWAAIEQQQSGVRPLRSLPADALPQSAGGEAWDFRGEIEDFGPLDKMTTRSVKKGLKVMCREIQMGVAAAQLALHDAELSVDKRDPERTGVSYGSDYLLTVPEEFTLAIRQCFDDRQQFDFTRWAQAGMPKVDPLWLLKFLPNMPASHIAILNDLRGPNNSITLREASANLALAEAYSIMSRGLADVMLVGATGSRLHRLRTIHVVMQEEISRAQLPPAELSRPFDARRSGMVLAEGAAALVLETREHAERRGARMLGELIGFGNSTVATRDGAGRQFEALRNAIGATLQGSGLTAAEIGHIHAHGLSTVAADRQEAEAIASIFGADSVPVTAFKSYTGHVGAAGGLLELIVSLLAFDKQQLPPVLNYTEPDPACRVRVVRSLEESPGNTALNLSFTPQGQATAVAVRRVA